MKTYVCFILLLHFFRLVSTTPFYNESDKLFDSYPAALLRRKRGQIEYNRWRPKTLTTTAEFIVKVPDDEIPTATLRYEPRSSLSSVELKPVRSKETMMKRLNTPLSTPKDYTRFMPPAQHPKPRKETQELFPVESYMTTRDPNQNEASFAPVLHPKRDESPPAGPQFLPRTDVILVRQFAPITPVSFAYEDTTMPPVMTPYFRTEPNQVIKRKDEDISAPNNIPRNGIEDELYDNYAFNHHVTPPKISLNPLQTTEHSHSFEEISDSEDRKLRNSDLFRNEYALNYEDFETSTEVRNKKKAHETEVFYDAEKPKEKFRHLRITTSTNSDYDDVPKTLTANNLVDLDYKADVNPETTTRAYYGGHVWNMPRKNKTYSKIDNRGEKNETNSETDTEETHSNEETIPVPKSEIYKGMGKHNAKLTKEPDHFSQDNSTTPMEFPIEMDSIDEDIIVRPRISKNCSIVKIRPMEYRVPHTLPEIVSQLMKWADKSPLAKLIDITNGNLTTMENPIYMMVIDDLSTGQIPTAKKTVMIVAGIHGRDHYSVAAAMYVMYELIDRTYFHAALLRKFRFWIIPVLNPDGYSYSITFPNRRSWVKNLKQLWEPCKGRHYCSKCETTGLRCTVQTCYGVNLDRNFEYQWIPNEQLRSEHPCSELYAGARQLSEQETRAFTNTLHKLATTPLHFFITFKEGDVLGILYPYSHTKKKRPNDFVLRQKAARAAAAVYTISGRAFVSGQTSEYLRPYAGGVEDWVEGHFDIEDTYTVMLYRYSDQKSQVIKMERVVQEAYAAMDTLVNARVTKTQPAVLRRAGISQTKNMGSKKLAPSAHRAKPNPEEYSFATSLHANIYVLVIFSTMPFMT